MMSEQKIHVLNLTGGGSGEHDIALICAAAISDTLKKEANIQVHSVEICKDGKWRYKDGAINAGNNEGPECELRLNHELVWQDKRVKIDYGISYIPGYPGETGQLPSLFELMKLPYFGCTAEIHQACFNKVTQKLWCKMLNIPMVEYTHVDTKEEDSNTAIKEFFSIHGNVVVKPARSGSSVGVSQASSEVELFEAVKLATGIDTLIVLERTVTDFTEYTVSCVEMNGELIITEPIGIAVNDDSLYSYEKKYLVENEVVMRKSSNLEPHTVATLKDYSRLVFKGMGLRHVSRIDFFVCTNGDILLVEINTFPGLVPGHSFLPVALEDMGLPLSTLFLSNMPS